MRNFNFLRSKSFALDLGNNNTLVSDAQSILLDQPSYIVFDEVQRSVKAVGEEAYKMFEKSHHDLRPVKPLRGGVIADYESASTMINEMVKRTSMKRSFYEGFDFIISGIPYTTTEVERRALLSALEQFNARRTYLLYEPLAAALGMGLNIQEPDGKMIVDIGGGITEIVIISLSGVAAFESLKVSGDSMDSDIRDHFRRKYNIGIGLNTAEQVKIQAGAVYEDISEAPEPVLVKGKNMITGIPVIRMIDHREVCAILEKSVTAIEGAIIQTLEKCPPELAADIYQNGIHITGGNALLRGLRERLQRKLKIPVTIDDSALRSVTNGIVQALRNPSKYKSVLMQ
jgi:rod shape-determining protein MreB